jgi:hypothetical protein
MTHQSDAQFNNDDFDLAALAAQTGIQNSIEATKKARELVEAARQQREKAALSAQCETADASGEAADEQRNRREKYLAENALDYHSTVKLITGRDKWSDALSWWKRFWEIKAAREGKSATWVEAKLLLYRNKKKIILAEVERLKQEFDQLSGYRGQGKVVSATDGRLKASREKKLRQLEKAKEPKQKRGRPRTTVKLVSTGNVEAVEAMSATGGKVLRPKPAY